MTARSLRSLALASLAVLALAGSLAACTKSTPGNVGTSTTTQTVTTTPATGPTGPLDTSPLTEKKVSACPYLSFDDAKNYAGFRLDKITELLQAGKPVGCRFYPSTYLAQSEHLPPPTQVAIELLASRYASYTAAFNSMVLLARAGTNPQQFSPVTGNTGICYRTTVWSKDAGQDWACAFTKTTELVVIRTVVNDAALNVMEIAKTVYPKF